MALQTEVESVFLEGIEVLKERTIINLKARQVIIVGSDLTFVGNASGSIDKNRRAFQLKLSHVSYFFLNRFSV